VAKCNTNRLAGAVSTRQVGKDLNKTKFEDRGSDLWGNSMVTTNTKQSRCSDERQEFNASVPLKYHLQERGASPALAMTGRTSKLSAAGTSLVGVWKSLGQRSAISLVTHGVS